MGACVRLRGGQVNRWAGHAVASKGGAIAGPDLGGFGGRQDRCAGWAARKCILHAGQPMSMPLVCCCNSHTACSAGHAGVTRAVPMLQ